MKNIHPGARFHYDNVFRSGMMQLHRIELVQIGELCLEPSFQMSVHGQFCCEISYVVSGRGIFRHNDREIPVQAGDVIVTPAEGEHQIVADAREPLFYAYAGFRLRQESGFSPEQTAFFNGTEQVCFRDQNGIYGDFRKGIDEFYREGPPDRLLIEACLTKILIQTYRACCQQEQPSRYAVNPENPGQLVHRILRYVNEHLSEGVSVAQIAVHVGYSAYYISHVFREKMDMSLQEYIGQSKIGEAKRLLLLKRFTVGEIARRLQYQNPQSFSRAFRRHTGCSPMEYIKQHATD